MGEDRVGWDVVIRKFVKDEVAVGFALQRRGLDAAEPWMETFGGTIRE
jgi:hypothetical protein